MEPWLAATLLARSTSNYGFYYGFKFFDSTEIMFKNRKEYFFSKHYKEVDMREGNRNSVLGHYILSIYRSLL